MEWGKHKQEYTNNVFCSTDARYWKLFGTCEYLAFGLCSPFAPWPYVSPDAPTKHV